MAKIETYVVPRHLYRYRSLTAFERELATIESGYLYCSTYKAMNDPMEGFYSSSKLLQKSADLNAVRIEVLSQKMQIGICSFSEVFNHELMWAHYARQFEGICIAYDFFNLRRCLPDEVRFSRVYYNEEAPEVGRSKQPRNLAQMAKMILSYKNHRWLYEREWRMFANVGKVHYDNPRCVARVYVGSRVHRHQRRDIERRLRLLKIPLKIQKLDGYVMTFQRESEQACGQAGLQES
jgi:Protein of unknown function (DUF2971)